MKLLLQHPHHHDHHHHHGKAHHQKGKKGRKIMKKMAKLEKKLSKYNFDSSSSEDSCSSDAVACNNVRSRSLSRSHKRRKGRRHHGRRFASRGRSSSSSSSSGSASDSSSSSSSSSSSRSPSPCDRRFHGRHHHHHGPPGHLSRSKSFAGRDNRSPSPLSRGPHQHQHHRHHPHRPPHHRGRFWRHQCRRLKDGLQGCFAMLAPESEICDVREKSPAAPTAPADQVDLMDLGSPSRSVSRERETQISVEADQDVQVVEQEAAEQGSVEGPAIDDNLAENWSKILREGLPSEARKDLMKKYPVSKSCSSLKGPQLNRELLPVASEVGVKIDNVQMHQQNQIGAGLTALGKAITDLNNKTELKKDQEVVDVLEGLNEAAVIIADAHHSMTKVRQGLVQSELNKRVRPVVDNCEHDEFLYGKDFEKKIENVKGFGKYKKANKKQEREGRCSKGEKRKQTDQDAGRRCKHSNFNGGAKVH